MTWRRDKVSSGAEAPRDRLWAAVCPACGRGGVPAPPRRLWAGLGRCPRHCEGNLFGQPPASCSACGGRKEKQDKRRGRRWRLRPVTTARSAGSYGEFPVYQKWGQKHDTGITIGVIFPECLEARLKSRRHPGDMHGFLLLCHTVLAGAPPQKLRY